MTQTNLKKIESGCYKGSWKGLEIQADKCSQGWKVYVNGQLFKIVSSLKIVQSIFINV